MCIEENQLDLNKYSDVLTCRIPILSPQLHSSLEKQELCTHDKCENQQPLERAEKVQSSPEAPLPAVIWPVWFPGNLHYQDCLSLACLRDHSLQTIFPQDICQKQSRVIV